MSQGIVHILDGYAQERGWGSSSRGSTRPASPASFGMGGLSLHEPARVPAGGGSSVYAAGSRGGSSTNLFSGGEGVGLNSMPSSAPMSAPTSNGGSRWTSRSQTPDLHQQQQHTGTAPSVAASTTTNATSVTNASRTTKGSKSTATTRVSATEGNAAAADGAEAGKGGKGGKGDGPKGNWRARGGGCGGGRGGRGGGAGKNGRQAGSSNVPPATSS
ncbi:hypothetical protein [Sporisorium scitamineum]|nr:hypothetical protein [Sporisorium scitamineum]